MKALKALEKFSDAREAFQMPSGVRMNRHSFQMPPKDRKALGTHLARSPTMTTTFGKTTFDKTIAKCGDGSQSFEPDV
jgi:hypothetical protein